MPGNRQNYLSPVQDLTQYPGVAKPTYQPPVQQTPQTPAPVQTPQQAVATQVAAPVAPAPTVADQLASIKNQALAIQSQIPPTVAQSFSTPTLDNGAAYTDAYNSGMPLSAKDEEAVRRSQLKMFQGQIDATNQIYDQMLREHQIQGQNRLGETTAMGARAGILGSDFAKANTDNQITANNADLQGVQAERLAKIGAINGLVNQATIDEIKAKNEARKQGADATIAYLKGSAERRANNLNSLGEAFITQGIDPNTLDAKTLKDIAAKSGTTTEEIIATYHSAKMAKDAADKKAALDATKTQSEIDKNNRITVNEGEALIGQDGKVIYKNPKTYEPKATPGNGSIDQILSDPTVKAWVSQISAGKAKISNVPGPYKNSVIRAMELSTGSTLNEDVQTATEIKRLAEELKADTDTMSDAVGPVSSRIPTMFGDAATYEAKVNRLKALISKSNLATMRGLGSMSNIEFQNMQAIGTSLGLGIGEKGFGEELQRIIDTTGNAVNSSGQSQVAVKSGTLDDGTVVTLNEDGTITDAAGNKYDENGKKL